MRRDGWREAATQTALAAHAGDTNRAAVTIATDSM
jgi:hypothetical protein